MRLYRGNRILNYVGYDHGRLIVGILAYYLHVTRSPADPTSGLTAHHLKALCAEQDVCSPGRARAMPSLLRLFGYIAPASGSDRRYKLLAPTALLTAFLRERWSAMFAVIALFEPEAAAARAALASEASGQRRHSISALAREDFLTALTRAVIDQFRTGVRAIALYLCLLRAQMRSRLATQKAWSSAFVRSRYSSSVAYRSRRLAFLFREIRHWPTARDSSPSAFHDTPRHWRIALADSRSLAGEIPRACCRVLAAARGSACPRPWSLLERCGWMLCSIDASCRRATS